MSWTAVIILGLGAYLFKAVGLIVGDHAPALARSQRLVALLPPALLAALVVVQTFDGGRALVMDARALGVGAGALVAWRKAPFIVVVAVAAAVTALARQL